MRWEKELSFGKLTVEWMKLGEDYMLTVWGGEAPHVGCAVLAVPRLSLTGDGTISATSSVINRTGHKDEILCRRLAERLAEEKNAVVCCAGGFHQDGITGEQIAELLAAADTFSLPLG